MTVRPVSRVMDTRQKVASTRIPVPDLCVDATLSAETLAQKPNVVAPKDDPEIHVKPA